MSPEFWDHMQPHHSMLLSEPLKVEASTCHCFAWQSDSEIVPHLQTPDKKRETRTTGWRLYVPKIFEGVKSGIWRNHNLIQPPLVSHKQLRCCAHPISFKVASIDTCSVSSLSSTWTSKPASRALAQWHAAIPFPKQSCCCALGRYTQTGGCPSLIKP